MTEEISEEKSTEMEEVETKRYKLRAFPEICSYINEEGTGYDIEIYLPGVERDTIDLKMDKDSIFVNGETERLRYVGSYGLCCPIDPDRATSTYKEGLLKISVPFKEPELKTVDVEVL
jgi:HSP20 family molecular chaperone IbpA